MKKKIETSVRINASRETIWKVLTNFEKYTEWNSFIKSVKGNVEVGNQINVVLQGMKFKPQVLKFDKNTEFKWLGSLWFKGLFDGEHRFYLTDNGDGTTTFEQSESFSGILVRLLSKYLDKDTKHAFKQMNRELKVLSEKIQG